MSLANNIYLPYQHVSYILKNKLHTYVKLFLLQTEYKESAEGILTIMKHHPSYENDLDVLHALLSYHDHCVPFTNTSIIFVQ